MMKKIIVNGFVSHIEKDLLTLLLTQEKIFAGHCIYLLVCSDRRKQSWSACVYNERFMEKITQYENYFISNTRPAYI